MNNTTYSPKASEIERKWYLIDADGKVVGRLAQEVAKLLKGKHKPTYSTHMDMGDFVIVVNADKVVLTGTSEATAVFFIMEKAVSGVRISPQPSPEGAIFRAGQPIFRSIPS